MHPITWFFSSWLSEIQSCLEIAKGSDLLFFNIKFFDIFFASLFRFLVFIFEIDAATGLPKRDANNMPIVKKDIEGQLFYHYMKHDPITNKPIYIDENVTSIDGRMFVGELIANLRNSNETALDRVRKQVSLQVLKLAKKIYPEVKNGGQWR